LAEEITLFATAEFSFITLPEAFSTGSSRHAPEEEPDLTELIRGKVGRIHGAAEAVTLQLKGLPLAYNKDLQETQEPAFSVDFVPRMLKLVRRVLRPLFDSIRERMSKNCAVGLPECHGRCHLSRPQGRSPSAPHTKKIGHGVRFAIEESVELGALTLDELRQFGTEFEEDFSAAVTLAATLDCHDVTGGTARERVRQALATASEHIAGLGAHTSTQEAFMLVRKALLTTDATNVSDLVNSLSGDGTLAQALLRGGLRKPSATSPSPVSDGASSSRLRRAALLADLSLCEVRSIVVKPAAKSQGAGGRILTSLIRRLKSTAFNPSCLFTRDSRLLFQVRFPHRRR